MLSHLSLNRIDFRLILVILALMMVSLLVISAYSTDGLIDPLDESFFTPMVKRQIQGFALGWGVFFLFASFDYNKLREWTWLLYR